MCPPHERGLFVYAYTQIRSTPSASTCDTDRAHVFDALLEFFQGGFGSSDGHWMFPFRQSRDKLIH